MDKKGLYLPVVEEFYSLQGEGYHTGKAAWFVRVGGCEVGCSFCDEMRTWNAAKYPMVDVDEIVARAAAKPARAVVVTGGEPLLYDMGPLTSGMHKHGIQCFLETSGSEPLSGVHMQIDAMEHFRALTVLMKAQTQIADVKHCPIPPIRRK